MAEILLEKYQVIIPLIVSIASSIMNIFIIIIALFGEQIKAKWEAIKIVKKKKREAGCCSNYTFEYPSYNKYEAYEELVLQHILKSGYFTCHIKPNRYYINNQLFTPVTFKITSKGIDENSKIMKKVLEDVLKG